MRSLLGGKLSLYGTLSLEPATIPAPGSPELFQTGETNQGVLLVDVQHPHDFFAQIAGSWEKAALAATCACASTARSSASRPWARRPTSTGASAIENPTAPLSHHNQDSTHISYDVLTLGLDLLDA